MEVGGGDFVDAVEDKGVSEEDRCERNGTGREREEDGRILRLSRKKPVQNISNSHSNLLQIIINGKTWVPY